ncbi:MAG: hypothetical protein K2W96_20775 [Gemmataceae bacterium]|nr:hypothetical protein [Gemmataceae bacterium]
MDSTLSWVRMPENEAAWLAAERVRRCLRSGTRRRVANPLFLHGPSGTGKSRLVALLADGAVTDDPGLAVAVLPASELVAEEAPSVRDTGLVVLEDVQRLPARGVRALTMLLDAALAHRTQVVLTATVGPALLPCLPARLVSRLAGGLVVGLEPFGPESRRAFLMARRPDLPGDTLDWLARTLPGSGRALEGALVRLRDDASLPAAQEALREDGEARAASVESIAREVGRYYRVDPACLRSRSRTRQALVPRQVGMYLARRLTALPLAQIGDYFGGRDHSTVLHACRKVEQALTRDAPLSQAVRELSAGLS